MILTDICPGFGNEESRDGGICETPQACDKLYSFHLTGLIGEGKCLELI